MKKEDPGGIGRIFVGALFKSDIRLGRAETIPSSARIYFLFYFFFIEF